MRTLIAVVSLVTTLIPSLAPAADDVPRYKLPVGRVLQYEFESKSKDQNGQVQRESSGSTRVVVVGQNTDGSSRIIVEQSFSYGSGGERKSIAGFDVTLDGKATPLSGFAPRVRTKAVLPLLPADAAQASSTWKSPEDWDASVTTFTAAKSAEPNLFKFATVEDSPINKIYVSTNKSEVEFDREKGIVTSSTGESSQGYGINQTSASTMKLTKDETLDPAKAAALGKDYVVLFESDEKRGKVLARISEEPEQTEKLIAEGNAITAEAAKKVTDPEVVAQFARQMKENAEYGKYSIEDGKRLAGILNKPAAEWSSKDLNDQDWSSAKLKGKIVVMDFWYRGCGWCMYAMPQVKQLAADYKDKGVVVLGMNTDRKEEDAKLVVDTLGLTYPQIRAEGLPKQFGVQGFPTLVIIDQDGVVRGFHVGYSKDLRESVGKRIDALLAKKPA